MATISQVAKEAGVSVATVSRVLNGSDTVKEATARKVTETIRRLNYVPNQTARNFRKSETKTILVLLPNITNQYYANVFDGLNTQAQESGYNIFLSTWGGSLKDALQRAVARKQADGAVLLGVKRDESWVDEYEGIFPIVQCCEFAENCATPHVSVDNYRAAYEAMKYLANLGRKRIGMIGSTNKFISTLRRRQGYEDALRDCGLPVREEWIGFMDDSYSYSSALVAAKQVLSQPQRPDALFCIGDECAFGVTVLARSMGIRVPEDLSVIGFDGIIYTTMDHPYITSVEQPCKDLGRTAVKLLLALLQGEQPADPEVILPYNIIVRESTCAIAET
jgi:LacI family transcriptional regulator, repressor for deo operon, udp, cdd, tsx, nupC, and nupG